MEDGESILDALNEEDIFENGNDDVEMLDVEEGELLGNVSQQSVDRTGEEDANTTSPKSLRKNQKRRANKKRNKRKKNVQHGDPNITDINRFVLDTCRRLREKKSYMVYTAVGCLGVSALCDLVKEVYAVQACGGQMTSDGLRSRTGGGILWSIIKSREPKAFKEIMNKAKEFEKQFKRLNMKPASQQGKEKEGSSQSTSNVSLSKSMVTNDSVGEQVMKSEPQNEEQVSNEAEKRVPVHERLRVPVSYDDDLLTGAPNDDSPVLIG